MLQNTSRVFLLLCMAICLVGYFAHGQVLFGERRNQNRNNRNNRRNNRNRNRGSSGSGSVRRRTGQSQSNPASIPFNSVGDNEFSSSSSSCRTVSGGNVGKPCIFPFTYNDVTYDACPVDPDDPTKTWCSTLVDQLGRHVVGQKEWGHCGQVGGRPSGRKVQSGSNRPTFGSDGSSGSDSGSRGRGCSGNERCRPISTCAIQYTSNPGLLESKRCTLPDDRLTQGLCCSDVTRNTVRDVFPNPEVAFRNSVGIRGGGATAFAAAGGGAPGPISDVQVRSSVNLGQSFAANVSSTARRGSSNPSRRLTGRGEIAHSRFQEAKPGVAELNRLALIGMAAARDLQNSGLTGTASATRIGIGLRQADVANTVLDDCHPLPGRCDRRRKYREVDGSCNNLRQPLYGRVFTPVQRVLRNAYADGFNTPRATQSGAELPSARLISTQLGENRDNPSPRWTVLFMTLGQFLDHDTSHVPIHMSDDPNNPGINCCTPDGDIDFSSPFSDTQCFPIRIPFNDPFFTKTCMNFVRSAAAPRLDCTLGPTEQVNQLTHWLDSSNVYGSEDEEARELRMFTGGRLKSDLTLVGELLPANSDEPDCKSRSCFLAGDGRVNEQPNLAAVHTLFLREHNRIAKQLQIMNNWSDERLYQETRRIVNAQWQHIIYNEFLPILLGERYMEAFGLFPLTTGFSQDYRDNFDPRITNEFLTAAFRVGHTLVPRLIRLFSGRRETGRLSLSDMFFNIDVLRSTGGVQQLFKGMTQTPIEEPDNNFVDDITNNLFDGALNGMDLVALNIQRGRDHGLPGYVEYRKICQIGDARSFDDLRNTISREKIARLRRAYQRVEDIDLFVGMFLEEPGYNGALVGRTYLCLLGDQFARLKKGDRFFYDLGGQAGSFTRAQLDEIRKTSLSRMICDNNDGIREIQPLALQMPNSQVNALTDCDGRAIPTVDLSPWRDTPSTNVRRPTTNTF